MAGYIRCTSCGRAFGGLFFRCPVCGGLPVLRYRDLRFTVDRSRPGIWRYSLMPQFARIVSKGEGLTPVSKVGEVMVKNERFNPTGTYADRASAVIASYLLSDNVLSVKVMLEEDFTASLAYYAAGTVKLYIVVPSISSLSPSDLMVLEDAGVEFVGPKRMLLIPEISYVNPLTVEGLKTIAFEIYEKRVKAENVVVPASTGTLAFSVAKGFQELREFGYDHPYGVVAAVPRGFNEPGMLRGCSGIRIEEVGEEEVLDSLVRLSKMGVKTKALSALAYAVAENLGNSVAVVTMGFKRPLRAANNVRLREELRRVLAELNEATAYELWKRAPVYTLRGTYKALSSMERLGDVCSEVKVIGGRKVRYYRLCTKVP